MYRETWLGERALSTAALAWAQSTASRARRGETYRSSSISFRACSGVAPASRLRVGSFTGRTPVSIPQGGVAPVRDRAARKKHRPMARRRWPSRWYSVPSRGAERQWAADRPPTHSSTSTWQRSASSFRETTAQVSSWGVMGP